MSILWVEKYRPVTLDDVVGQEDVVERLKSYVSSGNLPHLMFAGPAGTGKTTCAIALAKEIFGEDWKSNFQELNASDERGIDVVRNTIKNFARTAPMGQSEFKVIFLDEADSLTSDAQSALRRTMERYSKTCRFILSCNYSSKIIDPIQSRCAVFRFKMVSDKDMKGRLKDIAKKEGAKVTEEGLDALAYVARGDMRKAVNSLQVAATLGGDIDAEAIYRNTATARPEEVKDMLDMAVKGDFLAARVNLDSLLIEYGLSGEDVIRQIHRTIFDMDIDEKLKVRLIERTGETDFRLVEGSNERIQLESLLAYFTMVGGGN